LTRFVRDRILPTADLRTRGAETGQSRNLPLRGQAGLGPWVTAKGPQTLDTLAEVDPDAARILREAEQNGSRVTQISIEHTPSTAGGPTEPRLHFVAEGDPQAGIRAAAQIGRANEAPASFWYYDTHGPVPVREVRIGAPAGAVQPNFDAIQRMLDATGNATPHLVPRYTDEGQLASVYVLGKDRAGNMLTDAELRVRLTRAKSVLQQFGADMEIGPSAQAEVSHYAGEAGHAVSQAAAIERSEQILGRRPLPRPEPAGIGSGVGAGAAGDRAGEAGSAVAGAEGRARRGLPNEEDDLLDEDADSASRPAQLRASGRLLRRPLTRPTNPNNPTTPDERPAASSRAGRSRPSRATVAPGRRSAGSRGTPRGWSARGSCPGAPTSKRGSPRRRRASPRSAPVSGRPMPPRRPSSGPARTPRSRVPTGPTRPCAASTTTRPTPWPT
jgi:hypothetical protein